MRIDVVSLFPQMIGEAVAHSILKRAQDGGLVEINPVDLREFATDKHRTTDDTPCGGGGGMVMKVEPIARAVESLLHSRDNRHGTDRGSSRVILTDPQGELFTQEKARELSAEEHLIFLCGHYEGVDERVKSSIATDLLSVGDYVLTGGELPALVMIDAIVRLLPGALGDEQASEKDSFADGLLEYPHYTRPRSFHELDVPDILFSGHHELIRMWRRWHQLTRTRDQRPDLWEKFKPSPEDEKLLAAGEPLLKDEG